jgi:hypothetical protein
MDKGILLRFPLRNPELFSREINCDVLSTGECNHVLRAAIGALPHISDLERREELKGALCELLLSDDALTMNPSAIGMRPQTSLP